MTTSVEAVEKAAGKHCCKYVHDEIATACLLLAAA